MDLADKLIAQQQELVTDDNGEELKVFRDNVGLSCFVKDPTNPLEALCLRSWLPAPPCWLRALATFPAGPLRKTRASSQKRVRFLCW